MRKSYIKRIISITMSLSMILSGLYMINPAETTSKAISTPDASDGIGIEKSIPTDPRPGYVRGEAILSLDLAPGTDSELIHEGALPSDRTITVKHVMDFGKTGRKYNRKNTYIVSLRSSRYSADQLINKLRKYKNVKLASHNKIRTKRVMEVKKDPLFAYQWHLGGDAFLNNNSVYRPESTINYYPEESAPTPKDVPVVAVVDAGVDYEHEDLKNVMWVNPFSKKKLPGKHGYDCINDDDDPFPDGADDHGTNVSGVIAAENDNGIGIAGISKYARIMSLKIFDNDNYTTEAELMAYEYIYKAMKLGVNVVAVNCSFGTLPMDRPDEETEEELPLMNTAINKIGKKGALLIYSAGNEDADIDVFKYGYPQQLDHKYTVLVGASSAYDERASFSNYGKNTVDLFAPGDNIPTTMHTSMFNPLYYTATQIREKCTLFENFDLPGNDFKTIDQITGKETPFIKISHSKNDFWGNKNGGSNEVYLEKKKNPTANAYCMYYDITSLNVKPEENLHIFLGYNYYVSDQNTVEWDVKSGDLQKSKAFSLFTYGSRTYLRFDLRMFYDWTSDQIGKKEYFDCLSISKHVADQSALDRYDLIDGTSFSAPVVAGAVARLAVLYPGEDALKRKERLLNAVTKKPQYEDMCITGGLLDLAKLKTD